MIPGGVDCSLQPCFFNKSLSYENNYSFNSTSNAGVFNEIMRCTKKGGTISMMAHEDDLNFISTGKNLNLIISQGNTQKHWSLCLKKICEGELDPTFIVANYLKINELAQHYQQLNVENENLKCFIRI